MHFLRLISIILIAKWTDDVSPMKYISLRITLGLNINEGSFKKFKCYSTNERHHESFRGFAHMWLWLSQGKGDVSSWFQFQFCVNTVWDCDQYCSAGSEQHTMIKVKSKNKNKKFKTHSYCFYCTFCIHAGFTYWKALTLALPKKGKII